MSYNIQLMQREFIYNIDDTETGKGYTVTAMEDVSTNLQYMNYEFFNDEGEEVEDEQIIMRLMEAIESPRD